MTLTSQKQKEAIAAGRFFFVCLFDGTELYICNKITDFFKGGCTTSHHVISQSGWTKPHLARLYKGRLGKSAQRIDQSRGAQTLMPVLGTSYLQKKKLNRHIVAIIGETIIIRGGEKSKGRLRHGKDCFNLCASKAHNLKTQVPKPETSGFKCNSIT